jgi:hypothetical protein
MTVWLFFYQMAQRLLRLTGDRKSNEEATE